MRSFPLNLVRPIALIIGVTASAAAAQGFEDVLTGSPEAALEPLRPPQPPPAESRDTRPARPPSSPSRQGFSLAFVDADVRKVVDAVLGAMLGLDYSIDPKVQGTITLKSGTPVTREGLLALLESALGTVGAAIVPRGSSYRVVSRVEARANAPLATRVGTTGYATEVVSLRSASANEIARLLTQFLGKEIIAGTDVARSQVLISGSSDEREAARTMIARFDVDALAGMNFSLYRLENVDADTIVLELRRIFQPPLDIIGTRIRLVPLPRLRSILAIASDKADIGRIEPWLKRLDAGGSGNKRKLYSYAVQNGRARDLARSLQLVVGAGDAAPDPASTSQPARQPAGLTGGFGNGAGAAAMADMTPEQAQTPLPGNGNAALVATGGTGSLRIVPNDDTNSLLLFATGEEYDLLREALEKIDRPVPQILIQATLAEVTLNKDLSAGVDWSFLSGNSSFRLSNTNSGTPSASFPGFSYGYIGATAQAILNTLQSRTNVRVLSAPKLIVLNNQTATLQVGDQVPIVTQQSQSVAAPGAPVVNTIELRDTGVILKVTPRVNESGTVMLDIAQEVSDVVQTTTSGINSPTIQQRRLTTSVATRSGQMVALGGLIRDRTTRQKQGFPLLSQIPVLGAAFGRQVERADQTELIILLTPIVMRTPDEARDIARELIDQLDKTKPLLDRAIERQIGGAARP